MASRNAVTGALGSMPSARWLVPPAPRPSTARWPESSSSVAVAVAISAGWRLYGLVTPGPSPTRYSTSAIGSASDLDPKVEEAVDPESLGGMDQHRGVLRLHQSRSRQLVPRSQALGAVHARADERRAVGEVERSLARLRAR